MLLSSKLPQSTAVIYIAENVSKLHQLEPLMSLNGALFWGHQC